MGHVYRATARVAEQEALRMKRCKKAYRQREEANIRFQIIASTWCTFQKMRVCKNVIVVLLPINKAINEVSRTLASQEIRQTLYDTRTQYT